MEGGNIKLRAAGGDDASYWSRTIFRGSVRPYIVGKLLSIESTGVVGEAGSEKVDGEWIFLNRTLVEEW